MPPAAKQGNKPAAGDKVNTCNDPSRLPDGTIQAVSTVMIGG
jgi:hypothetical protein